MKVLTITDEHHDHVMCGIRYGLCEILGPDNVIDFIGSHSFYPSHDTGADSSPYCYSYYPGTPRQEELPGFVERVQNPALDGEIDAVFISFTYERNHDWDTVVDFLQNLPNKPVVAFINGDDNTYRYKFQKGLRSHVDFVFQREIEKYVDYTYNPYPTFMAIQQSLINKSPVEKPHIDISYLGNPSSYQRTMVSWYVSDICRKKKNKDIRFLVANTACIPWDHYMWIVRNSKTVLCPPGAGWDCFRTYEAIANGAVPVLSTPDREMIQQPDYYNDSDAIVGDGPEDMISKACESVLSGEWKNKRSKVVAKTLLFHTTEQRAMYVLRTMGLA